MWYRSVLAQVALWSLLVFSLSLPATAQTAQEEQATQAAGIAPPEKEVPRAKSPEELEAYQKFMQAQDPDQRIRQIEDFLLQFPETNLKEYAFQAATEAYQVKNDYAKVLTYGELTLAENEDNLMVLLILASAISDRASKNDADWEENLSQAEGYAKRALEFLSKLEKPPNLAESQWQQTKREAEATAHIALGMAAMVREEFAKAESELRLAVSLTVRPVPILLYRLGLCYSFQQKYGLALEVLERAAAQGGVKVTNAEGGTRDLVAEAKEFVLRARGEWIEPPVPAQPAPNQEAPTP